MSENSSNLNTNTNVNPWLFNLSNKNNLAKESCIELLEEQRISDIKVKVNYFDNCMNKFNMVYNKFYTTEEIEH
jgi:hypothetical protein